MGIFTRKLFIATLVCCMTFAVLSEAAAFKDIGVGDQAFPVKLRDLDGLEYSLDQYGEARAVLVLFWATWSERSMWELEDLKELGGKYGKEGLRILAVNIEKQSIDDEDLQRIRSAVLEREIDFPVLIDEGLKTYNQWGVISVPTTAIVGNNGEVVFELSSYPTSGLMEMDEAIRRTLGFYIEEEIPASIKAGYKPARNAMLHVGLGRRYAVKGFMARALPEFQKAAEVDSGWTDPWIYMSYLYLQERKRDKAVEGLRRAEELDQGREEVLLLRSYLLLKEQKVDEALALLQSEKSGGPVADPESLPALTQPEGTARTEESDTPEAVPVKESGLMCVRSLFKEGRMEDASARLEEIISQLLTDLGFPMKEKKTSRAMEKMKMMEKKQEQQ